MSSTTKLKNLIFEAAESARFRDPFTGQNPRSERALSGLLAFYGQRNAIDWSRVPLFDVREENLKRTAATTIIEPGGSYISEYLLLDSSTEEQNIWGQMPADVMYLSSDSSTVVLWENKIGGRIGYGPAPHENQFARQLRYLETVRRNQPSVKRVAFVLISGAEMLRRHWYESELKETLQHVTDVLVPCYVVTWESIFDAKVIAGP